MTVQFTCEVAFAVACVTCGETFVSTYKLAAGTQVPHPLLPSGWRVLDGSPVCLRHVVTIGDNVGIGPYGPVIPRGEAS